MKKRKIIMGILCAILAIIVVLAIAVAVIAGGNVRAMDHCVEAVLAELRKDHTVTAVDPGEYREMNMYGMMKFDVEK